MGIEAIIDLANGLLSVVILVVLIIGAKFLLWRLKRMDESMNNHQDVHRSLDRWQGKQDVEIAKLQSD